MSTEAPRCPNCKRILELARETDNWYEFGCYPCKFGQVIVKPSAANAAKARIRLERLAKLQRREQAIAGRPKYFDLGGSRDRTSN